MPSRQDQLHSHQFLLQRVVAALVLRDADPGRSPFPRAAGATVASVLVAVIAVGAVALYGTVVDAAPRWGDSPAVLVEKETGARFVYREGTLHPVPNHVSALLILGPGAETVLVSQRSIEALPRGVPLGIEQAPDAVPDPRRLATGAWTVCSTPEGAAVLVGAPAGGGAPLAERGLLVRAGADLHLIWQQRRHLLRDRDLVLSALGWTAERPTTAAPALLAALPEGPDLARIPVPDAGDATAVPGAAAGDVFVVESQGGGRQYAVALAAGLAPITQLQADLLLTDLDQREPRKLAQGDFADLPRATAPDPAGLPPTTPPLAPPGATVCATVPDAAGPTEVRVGASVPRTGIVVPPGGAALVEAGDIYLVTDRGRRHAMPDREVPALLGYGEVRPVRLPEAVVGLVPEGVRLDPAAARAPLGG
jgi:type VII secretion protein EccB